MNINTKINTLAELCVNGDLEGVRGLFFSENEEDRLTAIDIFTNCDSGSHYGLNALRISIDKLDLIRFFFTPIDEGGAGVTAAHEQTLGFNLVLDYACNCSSETGEVVKFLLTPRPDGVKINITPSILRNAINSAVMTGNVSAVRYLLTPRPEGAGTTLQEVRDFSDQGDICILETAVVCDQLEIVIFLMTPPSAGGFGMSIEDVNHLSDSRNLDSVFKYMMKYAAATNPVHADLLSHILEH